MTTESTLFAALRSGKWSGALEQVVRDLQGASDEVVTSTVVDPLLGELDRAEASAEISVDVATARLRRDVERVVRAVRPAERVEVLREPVVVSVVVTAHDVEDWIGEALHSLRAQSSPALEVIVVDDHSTDGTSQIVDDYAVRDRRFRVVRPVLRGGANARNIGVDLARGEFIAFCDGDDVVTEGAYERLLAGVSSDRTDIVFGDFERFSDTGISRPTSHITSMSEEARDVALDDHADLIANRSCWNKLFRASTWRRGDVVFVESALANDIVAVTSAYLAADQVSVVTSDVYRYRERPGGTSMSARSGAAASLAAYLEQERQCRELFVAANRPALTAEHERVSLKASTWGQVRRYLSEDAGDGIDTDVQVALQRLLDEFSVGEDTFAARRIVFALVAAGSPAAASTSALVGLKVDTTADRVRDLEGWAAAVVALPAPPTSPWQITTAEAFEGVLARRLASAADDATHDASVRAAVRRSVESVVQRDPSLRDHPAIRAALPDPPARHWLRSRFGRG